VLNHNAKTRTGDQHWVSLSFHPCLPFCWSHYKQQGLFAPRPLRRFPATTGPSTTLSPSFLFPVLPVIGQTCSRDFSLRRGGLLQLLNVSLSSCCR
jgi:hypothetical protein